MSEQKQVKVTHPELGSSIIPENILEKFLANEWILVDETDEIDKEKKRGRPQGSKNK